MSFLESSTNPETQSNIIVREFKDPFCFSSSNNSENDHHKSNLIPSRNKWSSTTSSIDSADFNKRRSSSRLSSSSDLNNNSINNNNNTSATSSYSTRNFNSSTNSIPTNNSKTSSSSSSSSSTDHRKSSCTISFDELHNGKDEINAINEQDKPLLRLWAQKNKTNAALSSSNSNRNNKNFPGPSNDSKKFLNQLSSTPWGKFLKSNNNMPSKTETRKSDNIIISTRATVKKDSLSSSSNNTKVQRPKSAYYERNLFRNIDATSTKGLNNTINSSKGMSSKEASESDKIAFCDQQTVDNETKKTSASTKRPTSRIFIRSKSEALHSDSAPLTKATNNSAEFQNHEEKQDMTKDQSEHSNTQSSQVNNDSLKTSSDILSHTNGTDERPPPVPKRSTSRSKEMVGYIRRQRSEQDTESLTDASTNCTNTEDPGFVASIATNTSSSITTPATQNKVSMVSNEAKVINHKLLDEKDILVSNDVNCGISNGTGRPYSINNTDSNMIQNDSNNSDIDDSSTVSNKDVLYDRFQNDDNIKDDNNLGYRRTLLSSSRGSLLDRSVNHDSHSDKDDKCSNIINPSSQRTHYDRCTVINDDSIINCFNNDTQKANGVRIQDEMRNRVPLTNGHINNIMNNGSNSNYTVNSSFASSSTSHIMINDNSSNNNNTGTDDSAHNNTIITSVDNTKISTTDAKTCSANNTDNTRTTTKNCSSVSVNNTITTADNNKATTKKTCSEVIVDEKLHRDSNNNIFSLPITTSTTTTTTTTESVGQLQQQQPLRYQKRDKSFNFSRKVRQQKTRSLSLFEFPSSDDRTNKDKPSTNTRDVTATTLNANDEHNDDGNTVNQRRAAFTARRDDRRRSVDFSRLVSAKPWKSNLIQQNQKISSSSSSLTSSKENEGEQQQKTVSTSSTGGETIGAKLHDDTVERKQGIQQKNYRNQEQQYQQQRHQREIIIPQTSTITNINNTVLVRKQIDIDISEHRPVATCLTNNTINHDVQRNIIRSDSNNFLSRQNNSTNSQNPYTDIESQITGIHLGQQDQLHQQRHHRENIKSHGISLGSTSLIDTSCGGLEAHSSNGNKAEEKIAFAFRPRSKSQPELFFIENETRTNIFSSSRRKLGTEQPCDAENHKQISYSLNDSIQQQNWNSSSFKDNIVNGDSNISISEMGSKYYTSNGRSLNHDHRKQQDSVFKTSSSLSTNLSRYNNESANMSDKYSRRKSFGSNEQHFVHKNRFERSYSLNEDYNSRPISTKTSRAVTTTARRSSEHDISSSLISSSYVPKSAYLRQRLLELQSGDKASTKDNQRRRSRENSISSSEDSHCSFGSFSKNSKKHDEKIDAFIRNHKERRSIEKTHSNSSSSSSFHSISPPYSPVKIVNKSTENPTDSVIETHQTSLLKDCDSSAIDESSTVVLTNKEELNHSIPDNLSERLSKTCQEILEQHQFHKSFPPPDTLKTTENLQQKEVSVFNTDTTTKVSFEHQNPPKSPKSPKSPEMESVFGRRGSLKDMKDAVVRRFASSSNSESKKSSKEKDEEILPDIQESPFDKSLVLPKSSSTDKVNTSSVKSAAAVKVTTKNRFGKEKSSSAFGSITKITSSKLSAASDLKSFSIKKKSKAETSKFDILHRTFTKPLFFTCYITFTTPSL